jgi:hypothetical protein
MSASITPPPVVHDAIVKWLVPDRVIYMWASGDISPGVREWMNTQAVYLYHSCATPRIHLFIDTRQVTDQSRATRQDQPAIWHPRRGWCVTLGAIRNPVLRALLNPLLHLFRAYIQDFASNEDAIAFLQKADPTLPDLQPYWEAIRRRHV